MTDGLWATWRLGRDGSSPRLEVTPLEGPLGPDQVEALQHEIQDISTFLEAAAVPILDLR